MGDLDLCTDLQIAFLQLDFELAGIPLLRQYSCLFKISCF